VKRLFGVALALGLLFSLLEEAAEPAFARAFRGCAETVFAVALVGPRAAFDANPDPATRAHWNTEVTLTGAREYYGFQCDSKLAYTALALFLSLWAASPLRGRRWKTLWRGLLLVALFVGLRVGLMVLQSVSSHACVAPEEHWSLLRRPGFAAFVQVVNWEIGMDLVVALFGPFLVWAVVAGRDVCAALGLDLGSSRPSATMPALDTARPAFDPFAPALPSVVSSAEPAGPESDAVPREGP
jgi:hypothetical protein